jgi:hypothetical protein
VGHEVFCDQWMPAYNYELLQDPPKFEARLLDCLCALEFWMRDELRLSTHRVDFILGLLTVDPNKRYGRQLARRGRFESTAKVLD